MDQRKKTRAFAPGAKAAARSGSARTDAGSGRDRNPPARPASAHVEDDDEKTLTAWPAVQPDARTRDIEVGGEPATGMRGPRPGANVPAAGMSPYTPLPDPMLGKIIAGRYRIISKLGEGGMGSVYLAQHVTLEKQVALKVLHGEFVRKSELVERFLQEARAASRIRHQNVIDITDFGSTDEGTVFFAMEVLDGHDLHEIITRAKLAGRRVPWARSRKIFLQICAALSAAHACGIVHRDLKPENIYLVEWLGHKDFVKLLDFGIAKVTEVSEHERRLTRTGMLFGTPEYMSPEQARGEKVDHRVDVYAMGIILYQLVTGSVPFEADNFMGVLSRHLTEEPPSIADDVLAAIGAPLGVNEVIRKALAKNRDARYATIDELAAALEGPGDVHVHDHGEAVPVAASAATSGGSTVPAETVDSPSMATRKRTPWTDRVASSAAESAGASAQRSASPLLWVTVVLAVAAVGAGGYMLVMGRTTSAGSGAAGTARAAADSPAGAPAAVAPVTLTFATEPPGAEVLDEEGAMLGKTPLEYTLPQGREVRRFRFQLPAHQDKIIEVVPAHSARHMVELTASIDDVSGPAAGGETARQTPNVGEAAQPSNQAPDRAPGSAAKAGSNAARDQRSSTSKAPAGKPADKRAPDESDDNDSADDPVIKNPFAD